MAEDLRMAAERRAYTLSDRGTYLALARSLRLTILFQGDPSLRNPYAVICVNPRRHPRVNIAGARQFAAFLLAPRTQRFVAGFGRDRFGQPLFYLFSKEAGRQRRSDGGAGRTGSPPLRVTTDQRRTTSRAST
jgi:tungstate transport system substrate-binding protein